MKAESLYYPMQGQAVSYANPSGRPVLGKKWRANRLLYIVAAVLTFGVFLTFVNVYELRRMQGEHYNSHIPEVEASTSGGHRYPIVWVYGKKTDGMVMPLGSGYLKHVFNVFDRIGYMRGTPSSDWDVLWCHDYPFITLHKHLINMKPHQRVNHFPGSGFVTNKLNLAMANIKYLPKSFKIPRDKEVFQAFVKKHPDWKWVQKGNSHRGVKLLGVNELDMASENTFIQQYIDDPLLIDGRRFDIGIYAAVTSINPLRIYINQGDWLVRFCPEEYEPFDPTILSKYVVNDNYMPLWKVPALKKLYTDSGYTFRDTLLTHLKSKGYDIKQLQEHIKQAIRAVYMSQESRLITAASKYKATGNFFEMVRFDFVLTKNLKVYLLEVNMSPNLSSGHFAPNKQLYEGVVFGLLNLVGVARTVTNDLPQSLGDELDMQVSDRDIAIQPSSCISEVCEENCLRLECRLCLGCLTPELRLIFKRAYLEHINRRTWRRVLPISFQDQGEAERWAPKYDPVFRNASTKNQFIHIWFRGKCLQDATWCS